MKNNHFPENLIPMGMSWNDTTSVKLTDGKKIFKYINVENADYVSGLHSSGLIDNLTGRGLLQPGVLRKTGIPDFPLVLECPFIDRFSYPFEWPALAFKDVALAILDIEETANRYGYTLYDPHPFNVAIHEGHPLYLDYGSFISINQTQIWQGYDKAYRDFILFPLGLYQKKLHYIGRLLLREIVSSGLDIHTRNLNKLDFKRNLLEKLLILVNHRHEITSEKWAIRFGIKLTDLLLRSGSLKAFLVKSSYWMQPNARGDSGFSSLPISDSLQLKAIGARIRFIKRLRKKIQSIKVSEKSSHWSKYYTNILGENPPWERDISQWTAKERAIKEIIEKTKPNTVLDIGANTGWFSSLAARMGSSVIAIDRDEECINQLYLQAQHDKLPIQPLIMDVRQPTPEYELNIGTIASLHSRLTTEMVMALAVIHHMVSNQGITLEHLAHILANLSKKWVIAEFVPVNEELYSLPSLTEENWNVTRIRESFESLFDFVDVWDSFPAGRKLLLFRKKAGVHS